MKKLIGKKITNIYINSEFLQFKTNDGSVLSYRAYGDCCSESVFYDFIGVKKLLENGPVVSIKEIELGIGTGEIKEKYQENMNTAETIYGVEIVTEHPVFGKQTAVFSFRNYSNGYYGGMILDDYPGENGVPEIFDDITEIENP